MNGFGEILFFIILGAAVILKTVLLVWDIVDAIKRRSRGKRGIFAKIFSFSGSGVNNYIQDEQNRIFTENSIRAHEQAMADHMSAAQWHNDTFNNLF